VSIYVRGETGDPACRVLLAAIENCERRWQGDPAYKEVLFHLDKVQQELDLLTASAGHRASIRAALPNNSGQELTHREEPPSYVQCP
jgi:hypothetical protein